MSQKFTTFAIACALTWGTASAELDPPGIRGIAWDKGEITVKAGEKITVIFEAISSELQKGHKTKMIAKINGDQKLSQDIAGPSLTRKYELSEPGTYKAELSCGNDFGSPVSCKVSFVKETPAAAKPAG